MKAGENERVVRSMLNTIVKEELEGQYNLSTIHNSIFNRLNKLTISCKIEILKKAIGNDCRRKHAVLLLLPEVVNTTYIEETVAILLTSTDTATRCCALQIIGLAGLKKFIPMLHSHLEKENDLLCRKQLLHALKEIEGEISVLHQQLIPVKNSFS